MTIKCLSLWQPWAEAMRLGLKKNETRSWSTPYRGWLAIHAAKRKFNPNDYEPEFAHGCRARNIWPDNLTYGAVVCIVKLVQCEPTIHSVMNEEEAFWGNYEPSRFAWLTDSMIRLPQPIALRGHQALFDWQVPSEVEQLLSA